MKYRWASDWYRQAMNNFWIPEEINLSQDVKKTIPLLTPAEREAYEKTALFLVFLVLYSDCKLPSLPSLLLFLK